MQFLFGLLGGLFNDGYWESERSRLHHNDYHYRFYHYLSPPSGGAQERFAREMAAALEEVSAEVPASVAKAIKNWPALSARLRDLFDRALREALMEPEAILARMALEEVERANYTQAVTEQVRRQARDVLESCAKRNAAVVQAAIAEPRRLVDALDEFVRLFKPDNRRRAFPSEKARQKVEGFLENCRQLDRALSDIPRRLSQRTGGQDL
jgi:acyl-CoA reductase-like NAD-dependent aldehyde dehydrogenase